MSTHPVELTLPEASLLLSLLSERIVHSDELGIPREDPSSAFRDTLLHKLIAVKQVLLDAAANSQPPGA